MRTYISYLIQNEWNKRSYDYVLVSESDIEYGATYSI